MAEYYSNNELIQILKKQTSKTRSPEEVPATITQTVNVAELQSELDKYKRITRDLEMKCQMYYEDYLAIRRQAENSIPIDNVNNILTKYAKVKKLTWKGEKNSNIINSFIAMLEHTELPSGDEELVD